MRHTRPISIRRRDSLRHYIDIGPSCRRRLWFRRETALSGCNQRLIIQTLPGALVPPKKLLDGPRGDREHRVSYQGRPTSTHSQHEPMPQQFD